MLLSVYCRPGTDEQKNMAPAIRDLERRQGTVTCNKHYGARSYGTDHKDTEPAGRPI